MSGLETLALDINIGDVFSVLTAIFNQFWLLIAIGLALLAFPRVVRSVRASVGGSR